MYFIKAASTISHQPTFGNPCFSKNISLLKPLSEIIHPAYKKYIDPALLRRMSKILRMSVACSVECVERAGKISPDAIIVGTGLGCLDDTEKFLNNIISLKGSLLPPTSFIQSTHNTIAGQISLLLQNHNYNITHTQNTLSFEYSLLDALLCIGEGKENILVGAADEFIKPLDSIALKLNYKNILLTSGASFFVLSEKETGTRLVDVAAYSMINSFSECIYRFFSQNKIGENEIDLVLFAASEEKRKKELISFFEGKKTIDYETFCGTYFTNSAFALHLAEDILKQFESPFGRTGKKINRILVCNNLNSGNLGLILAERNET